ncbi:hypothetical protein MNBD_GAMMA16-1237 [hydrothermal vent metagenome]|uniref:VTT domain-containing protein n=1 Tax=hydrothermal vent metagenome TaxID=652676 RepID=A0A3B0ZQX3_9ZZZZ
MEESLSLWALFASSFISSTLLPGGSELVVVALVMNDIAEPATVWFVATTGNVLGGISSWCVGRWLVYKFEGSKNTNSRLNPRAIERVRQWGGPVLLLSWVPVIGDPLCVAAGWLKIHFITAIIFITIGKALRYAVIVWLV